MSTLLVSAHGRRYQKAKQLGWDPREVDLTADIADWRHLDDAQREAALRACALFLGGEEAVAADLAPLLIRLRREPGQRAACFFLASQIWEEAKHAEFFARWIEEVAGGADLDHYLSPSHRRLFGEVLPQSLDALLTDESPEALVRAITTYHLIIEGTLAESGYEGFYRCFRDANILPGLVRGIQLVQRDEARHIAFGIDLLRELFQRDSSLREVMEAEAEKLFDLAIGTISEYFAPYPNETNPFGLTAEDLLSVASSQWSKRYAALSRPYEMSH
ncbi:R2-like ligand-binding oxidase [soil metagenome]